jgi:hypothetical protein
MRARLCCCIGASARATCTCFWATWATLLWRDWGGLPTLMGWVTLSSGFLTERWGKVFDTDASVMSLSCR